MPRWLRIVLLLVLGGATIGIAVRFVTEERTDAPARELTELAPALVRAPSEAPPPRGWPVMLLLHGAGTSGQRFTELASAVNAAGMATVVPTGTRQEGPGHYVWEGDVDAVDRFLSRAMDTAAASIPVDRTRLLIGGYSQGASYAIAVAARRPDLYRGVLAIGAVGPSPLPKPKANAKGVAALSLLYGRSDPEATAMAATLEVQWRAIGGSVDSATYDGAHRLPDGWPALVTARAAALLASLR